MDRGRTNLAESRQELHVNEAGRPDPYALAQWRAWDAKLKIWETELREERLRTKEKSVGSSTKKLKKTGEGPIMRGKALLEITNKTRASKRMADSPASAKRQAVPAKAIAQPKDDVRSKRRSQQLFRRRAQKEAKKNGAEFVGLRPPTTGDDGCEYTPENDDFIIKCYRDYAEQNGDERMSMKKLMELYNNRFPGEDRSLAALKTHIDRKLKHLL